jgi:hypothetical protein
LAIPGQILGTGLIVWLALLFMLIIVRVLRGDIRHNGFLADSRASDQEVVPERVVSVVVFPMVITMYALQALSTDVTTGIPRLPDVPDYLMSLLVGGNGLYLAGKIMRRP